ncbi:unnamed protein product [Closterium sp. NIES-64]|nr:unnamed protein product [Closterium sp. NIES-64]
MIEGNIRPSRPILDAPLESNEESGLLAELLRRHDERATFEAPQEWQTWSEEESGLLAELLRRQGTVEDPIVKAAVMHLPHPFLDVPQVSNEKTGQLSRRQGQLEYAGMAPFIYQPRLPVKPQEPTPLLSHSSASSEVPGMERAMVELYREQQRQPQQQVGVESWILHAYKATRTESMVVPCLGDVNTIHRDAATRGKSMVIANNTIHKDAAKRVEDMVVAGLGDTTTIDRYASASASLVQQQQVAVTSWVAHAELAGLTLPPNLIQESVHAAHFAQMQMQVEQGGTENLTPQQIFENLQVQTEVEQPILAFPERLEEGGCLGVTQEEGGMLEVLMLQDGGMEMHWGGMMQEGGLTLDGGMMQGFGMMQEGGMRRNTSLEVHQKCAFQEAQGSVSVDLSSTGGHTGPGNPCLSSPENELLPGSPASPPAAAAAAASYPHSAFVSPSTPGVFCTPASAGACCSPAAAPSVCPEGERGQAFTLQEPPATRAPLVGSELIPEWLEVKGVEDERGVREEKSEVREAKQKEGWGEEDWRPRIRARLGLGCIQARSMKERRRRDRIRKGLEQLHQALPPSLARAQLDTATMVESAFTHIKDLQEKPSSRHQDV